MLNQPGTGDPGTEDASLLGSGDLDGDKNTPPDGGGNGGGGGGSQNGGGQNNDFPKWMAQNAGEYKTHETLKQFQTINDLSDAYLKTVKEMEELKAGKAFVPGEDATEEEKKAFLKSIGVPEDVNEYKKVDTDLPEGVQLSEEQFKGLQELALTNAWTEKQFEAFQKWYADEAKREYDSIAKHNLEEKEKIEAHFKNEWGSDYTKNIKFMEDGIKALGGKDLLEKLNKTGLGNDPKVISFLVEKGKSLKGDSLLDGDLDDKEEVPSGQIYYPSMKGL